VFFDAGQALSVLVTLPDGKHILVDAGELPTRPGCGAPCTEWHQRVMTGLARELGAAPIDLLWITHPHSDHIGGVVDVLDHFTVRSYVDNGRDLDKRTIRKTHDALSAHHVSVAVIEPGHTTIPLEISTDVKLTALVPPHWYEGPDKEGCAKNPNICTIALRIDYCASSVLFLGDAEALEEADLAVDAPVTLLQVGHHGSRTSSSPALLDRAKPKYAVISAAKAGEGTNRTYCHPRKETVDALTAALGGVGSGTIHAFPSVTKCDASGAEAQWIDEPASNHLWLTARDGDVVLTTTGDGVFTRE
jgi:competence protein ComEC